MSFDGSDYYDCNKNDSISLEPRLSEYINKKKYYKQNSIESNTLEKDYNISDYDKLRIKAHLKGSRGKNLRHQDYVDTSQAYFPSDLLKKDPRFDRIKKKQQKNKEAHEQRHNYGDISNSFDMFRDDRPFASAFGDDFHSKDYNHYELDDPHVRRNNGSHRDFNELNTYKQPRSRYNGRAREYVDNSNSVDSILSMMDGMNQNYSRTEQQGNVFDEEYLTIRPNVRGKKSFNQNSRNIQSMPFMGDMRGNRDVSIENFVKFGDLTRETKSNGYPNPVEHYFDYITPDIQDPRHVVMDRGLPSRSMNRGYK